jgi:hypothetical protein
MLVCQGFLIKSWTLNVGWTFPNQLCFHVCNIKDLHTLILYKIIFSMWDIHYNVNISTWCIRTCMWGSSTCGTYVDRVHMFFYSFQRPRQDLVCKLTSGTLYRKDLDRYNSLQKRHGFISLEWGVIGESKYNIIMLKADSECNRMNSAYLRYIAIIQR